MVPLKFEAFLYRVRYFGLSKTLVAQETFDVSKRVFSFGESQYALMYNSVLAHPQSKYRIDVKDDNGRVYRGTGGTFRILELNGAYNDPVRNVIQVGPVQPIVATPELFHVSIDFKLAASGPEISEKQVATLYRKAHVSLIDVVTGR